MKLDTVYYWKSGLSTGKRGFQKKNISEKMQEKGHFPLAKPLHICYNP